ncbi:MAG: UDP-N-acetylenolpyruvoylglucosamine reductase [Betaproteobacteria bacterium RBG_16_58_11]|nr:MAG: UDP-N-acetylenolpyruvoylglucosamine reductase [Betaproteobacteria bacterium RBG_16_58_11]
MKGTLRFDEPMAKHVSWRAGGYAARAYVPKDLDDLAAFLKALPPAEALLFVGLGSNLLVRDGGFKGTVILMHAVLNTVRVENERIYAEAGVASPKLARFSAKHDFEGAEFLAGIPGTIGGALAMNAGCYGVETWEVVDEVQTIDRQGELRQRKPADYEISYRHVALRPQGVSAPRSPLPASQEWFVAAWFKFKRGDGQAAQQRIKALLQKRISAQPLELPNAGSVFRNPAGDYAARLIEACGLKGKRIGGAQVSEKHANFIVNLGDATAADIECLISMVQDTVRRERGVVLEREVRIVGDSVSGSGEGHGR